MGTRFVFIRPKSIHQWEALGVGYLAAYSYRYGGFSPRDYSFFDGIFDDDESIVLGCSDAEFIGFTLTSFSTDEALRLIGKIKNVNTTAKIVWGGVCGKRFYGKTIN